MNDNFEKFTERARRVLSLAQYEAQQLNHNYMGTEHLLLGLLGEPDGVAHKMLEYMGAQPDRVRASVMQIIGRGDRIIMGEIGLTPRSKKAIELAVDEARRLNQHFVGTEHLLLGLIREGDGVAAGVLKSAGVTLERARSALTDMMMARQRVSGAQPATPATTAAAAPTSGTTPASAPKNNVVTCRLDDAAVDALDALVEAGIRSTRSDAAAWLISAGIEAHRELFDRVNTTVNEIRKLRLEARDIARQVTEGTPEPDDDGESDVKDPEEPDDLDDLGKLDEPPTS